MTAPDIENLDAVFEESLLDTTFAKSGIVFSLETNSLIFERSLAVPASSNESPFLANDIIVMPSGLAEFIFASFGFRLDYYEFLLHI